MREPAAIAYQRDARGRRDGMTDASAAQAVKLFGADAPRLGVLIVNTVHTTEHYGNLVTYMRLKNIVPPSSEPGSKPGEKKCRASEPASGRLHFA